MGSDFVMSHDVSDLMLIPPRGRVDTACRPSLPPFAAGRTQVGSRFIVHSSKSAVRSWMEVASTANERMLIT